MSAAFAALTAIFASSGSSSSTRRGDPQSARWCLIVLTGVVAATAPTPGARAGSPRTYTFLVLSGLATGVWWCYFRARHIGATPLAWRRSIS